MPIIVYPEAECFETVLREIDDDGETCNPANVIWTNSATTRFFLFL